MFSLERSFARPMRIALVNYLLGACLLFPTVSVAAGPPAPSGPDYRKGVLYGKVLDAATGKPVADATVGVQDPKGQVLAWSKTNAQGEYALAVDPKTALQLYPSRQRGLLEQVCRSVGNVVAIPIKAVGNAVVNPGQTVGAAAISIATGSPAALAAQMAAPSLTTDPQGTVNATQMQARGAGATTAVGQGPKARKVVPERGKVVLVVSAPNYKDIHGKAGAFWLEAARTDRANPCGIQAWLETARLAPAGGDKNSEIVQEALVLAEPHVEPTLAPAGTTLKIRVKLQAPDGPPRSVRLFAREQRKNVVVELMPGTGADSMIYAGQLTLDPKTPKGESVLTIAALRTEPVEVHLDKNKPDPLVEFVRRLEDMQAGKPYEYDPRIMASTNRLDVKVTVLDPRQATPTAVSTPDAKPGGK